jgi:ribosome-associated protein
MIPPRIPEARLEVRTSRSSGPGGQHVNKTESKVEIRFRLAEADWIPPFTRDRLATLFPNRLSAEGDFVIVSQKTRSQNRNYEDCLDKLRDCLLLASERPRERRATKPTRGSKERRLRSKSSRADVKSGRRKPSHQD